MSASEPSGVVETALVIAALRSRDFHYTSEGDRGRMYRSPAWPRPVYVKKTRTMSRVLALAVLRQAGFDEAQAEAALCTAPPMVGPPPSVPLPTKV